MKDKILIINYTENTIDTWRLILRATDYESFVYTFEDNNVSVEQLKKLCEYYSKVDPDSAWLWSHPTEGGDSTPVPCLIQQEQTKLEKIRQLIGYYDE